MPLSTYGYWVSPDGQFCPVDPWQKHIGFARRVLRKRGGCEGGGNSDWRVDLISLGWTRVALHSGRFCVQLPPVEIADGVIAQLHELVQEAHYGREVPISVEDNMTGEYAGGHTVRPGDPKVARQWVRVAEKRGVALRFKRGR